MFEYTKTVLLKLSFDRTLFKKELEKSLMYLDAHEIGKLKIWLETNFNSKFHDDIHELFYYKEGLVKG
ncbi:MAG: hypothetical protein IPO21_11970 [Bacteroidales bacterium]|nr:hypothetical protein [Bacteroidales bacterium]